jgi:mRNA-capping enzyme
MSYPPPRWLNCPCIGNAVSDCFVPFKVPLKPFYDEHIPVSRQFHVEDLFSLCKANSIRLGLVIDLTKTSRYYDYEEILKRNCQYQKISCEGHQQYPTAEEFALFKSTCVKFLEKNPSLFIGVHCTHGYNRTGFMICSYLAEQEGWSIEAAVESFRRARPDGIYKRDYLKRLYEYYGGNAAIVFPGSPTWKDDEAEFVEQSPSASNKRFSEAGSGTTPKRLNCSIHMAGIEGEVGESVCEEELFPLRQLVHSMTRSTCPAHQFPGSQPVSLDYDNVQCLLREPYLVSWKADGIRYMMLIRKQQQESNAQEVFMIDRHYNFFRVPLRFPRYNDSQQLANHTLLDGELVEDKIPEAGVQARYLIFDVIVYEGNAVGFEVDFAKRLRIIEENVIGPRNKEKTLNVHASMYKNEPFSVRLKNFYSLEYTQKVATAT